MIVNIPQNPSNSTFELQMTFNDLWKNYMVNSLFLQPSFRDNSTINIFTSFPFTKNHCEHVHPILYNTFNISHGFAKNNAHFPNKVGNFHDCPLKISTVEIAPFSMLKKNFTGQINGWGIDGIFTTVVGRELKSNYEKIFTHQKTWKNSSAENAMEKALEMVIDGHANFSIGFMTESRRRNSKMASSYSYYTTNLVWVIGAGKPLTAIEIFSKPFQKEVWSCIIVVIGISFWVIRRIKKMNKKVSLEIKNK
jgi:hypothetical protein